MFEIDDDMTIYITRGDVAFFSVTAGNSNGIGYKFQPGDVVRMKVYAKKDASNVAFQKDFPVLEETDVVEILLTEKETKIGDIISKPVDYWYEVELNPYSNPQTIIGYDDDGPKIFKLFPEGRDLGSGTTPEDVPVVDTELSLTSNRPVENQAITRALFGLQKDCEHMHEIVENSVEEWFDESQGRFEKEIDEWLDEHPEATTTVQDHSLTIDKMVVGTLGYVTPEMFGAVGDGVTDDYEALQNALHSGFAVYIPERTYLTTKTLDVPSEAHIYGVERRHGSGATILTNNDIIVLNLNSKANIVVENLTITHPNSNTQPVVDMTNTRYTTIKQVILLPQENKASENVGFYGGDVDGGFNGYNLIDYCQAAGYVHGVDICSTFTEFRNCTFNSCSSHAVKFKGEVCLLHFCDISSKNGVLDYTGTYRPVLVGCYMESGYIDSDFKLTQDTKRGVDIIGGKTRYAYDNAFKAGYTCVESQENFNMLGAPDGNTGNFQNLLVNGDFSKGLFGWDISSGINEEIIDADGCKFADKCLHMTTPYNWSKIEQKVKAKKKFKAGQKCTLGFWYKGDGENSYLDIQLTNGTTTFSRPTPTINPEWQYLNCYATLTEDCDEIIVQIYTRDTNPVFFANIVFNLGWGSFQGNGYSQSEDLVFTDNVILKGENGSYYKISVNSEGQLTATETETIDI